MVAINKVGLDGYCKGTPLVHVVLARHGNPILSLEGGGPSACFEAPFGFIALPEPRTNGRANYRRLMTFLASPSGLLLGQHVAVVNQQPAASWNTLGTNNQHTITPFA